MNGFAPAPFPSLSTQPPSPFKGINEQEHLYGYDTTSATNGNGYMKSGLQPLDELQSLQKGQGQYGHGHTIQTQDYPSSQGQLHAQCDAFSMDSMQHSLRAASVTSPFTQQQQQYIQQQTLPPRSPQMAPLTPHQQPQYFSPGRGRSNSSPLTTSAFPHLATVSEYHPNPYNVHGQGQNSAYSTMPGSPYLENSRGPSPVGSEYSYGCGSGGFSHNVNNGNSNGNGLHISQGQGGERQFQRASPQHQQESHMQFSSIDQQPHSYEGCIYQVSSFHRVLVILSLYIQTMRNSAHYFPLNSCYYSPDFPPNIPIAGSDSLHSYCIINLCCSCERPSFTSNNVTSFYWVFKLPLFILSLTIISIYICCLLGILSVTRTSSIDFLFLFLNILFFQVQFKRSHRCLILSPSATQGIKPGDFVIVEADRGEDLGVVVSMAPRDSPLAATIFAACSSSMRYTNKIHNYLFYPQLSDDILSFPFHQ